MGRIKLEKLENTRDLGGFKTKDGKEIIAKALLRSGTLFDATENDKRVLVNEYNLKKVVDFRTDVEREQKPDPELNGVENLWVPILEAETLGITREKVELKDMPKIFDGLTTDPLDYMKEMYSNIVMSPCAQKGYGKFFEILLEENDGSVLWHCSAGKDRVGVGTALLLTVLGVDREEIIEDYLMTSVYYKRTNLKLKILIKLFIRNPRTRNYLFYLMDVKREYIEASFEMIEKNFGSVEDYLDKALNISPQQQDLLRKKYLK